MIRTFTMNHLATTIGNVSIREWAKGEGVSFEFDGEDSTIEQGNCDASILIQTANNVGTLTVRLNQGAAENDALSRQRNICRASGILKLPFSVVDVDGTSLITGQCAYKKPAGLKRGDSANPSEWTFSCEVDPEGYNVGMNF